VVFYSLCITAIFSFLIPGVDVTWENWVNTVFPIARNQYWFFTSYVALFFTMPLLNHLITTIEQKQLQRYLIGGFLLLSVYPTLVQNDLFSLNRGYSFLWFMYLYLVGAYCSRFNIGESLKKRWLFGGFGLTCLLTVLGYGASTIVGRRLIGAPLLEGLFNYNSILIFVEAVCLFLAFKYLKIANNLLQKIITFVSPAVFYVYILHDNPLFRSSPYWKNAFVWLLNWDFIPGLGVIIGIFFCGVIVFLSCVIIEKVRQFCLRYIKQYYQSFKSHMLNKNN
jgi:hypothetical protein